MLDLLHTRVAHIELPDWVLLVGVAEVDKHLAKENTPDSSAVAVFHFDQPALKSWLLVLPTEEKPQCIALNNVLKNPNLMIIRLVIMYLVALVFCC